MDDVSFVDDIMHYEGWLKLPLCRNTRLIFFFFQVYIMQNEGWLKLPLSRNTRLVFFFLQRMRLNLSSSHVFGSIIDCIYSELLPVCNYRFKGVSFVFLFFLIIIGMILTCL